MTLDSFLINTYFWWKFTLATSYKYYLFLAVLDNLKWKIFFFGNDGGRQYFIIGRSHPLPQNFFISTGLHLGKNCLFLLLFYNILHILGVFQGIYLSYPTNNYLFNVSNKNTRKRRKIGTKLTIKTLERRHCRLYC